MSEDITFTVDNLLPFIAAYENAVMNNQDSFMFEDHEFLTGYAKYVIMYLKQQLRVKD